MKILLREEELDGETPLPVRCRVRSLDIVVRLAAERLVVTSVASIMAEKHFDPETGRKIASHILTRHEEGARESDSVTRSWMLPYVPGKRLPDVDLYILTSSKTVSAGQDFVYTLQQLKRAVVVGERTKGGAHPVDVLIVEENVLTQVSQAEIAAADLA